MNIVSYSIVFVLLAKLNFAHPKISASKNNAQSADEEASFSIVNDSLELSKINAQFIQNFLRQDATAHAKLIHKNFICIESNGSIADRDTYLKNWATDFDNSGYTSFTYSEESIRIFGDVALVRSKTIYTKNEGGKEMKGYTIYTDTYFKENGDWKCVQVQITPVK